jgi:hypothetical protein
MPSSVNLQLNLATMELNCFLGLHHWYQYFKFLILGYKGRVVKLRVLWEECVACIVEIRKTGIGTFRMTGI